MHTHSLNTAYTFSILDLSKLHIYKLHYDVMKSKYNDSIPLLNDRIPLLNDRIPLLNDRIPLLNDRIPLLMADTDSLVYGARTKDTYQDVLEKKQNFACIHAR
jgi:hypothetical protein